MKHRHIKKICIAVLAVVFLIAAAFVGYRAGIFQRTTPERLPNLYRKEIEPYISTNDTDGDGIDNQTDILESAVEYVNTKPKYKSKYYTSGYPDDQFGVCTDVVAFALKGAGYDLKSLVQADISAHPNDYDIEKADPAIDFRRVKNLKVFFKNTATSLTTDIHDIEEWQGGDIVIFENHIGIVSDRRNANGVSYVIHHNNPGQKSYEEDILEKRIDIAGHYRM